MRVMMQITGVCLLVLTGWHSAPTSAQGLLGQEPKVLDMTRGSWAYFRDYNGRQLIYFTHLEAYKCGISSVSYSLNSDALDKIWKLQSCDLKNPHNVTTDKPYISLPLGTAKSITVQLTFNDGAKSKIVRIGSNNQIMR